MKFITVSFLLTVFLLMVFVQAEELSCPTGTVYMEELDSCVPNSSEVPIDSIEIEQNQRYFIADENGNRIEVSGAPNRTIEEPVEGNEFILWGLIILIAILVIFLATKKLRRGGAINHNAGYVPIFFLFFFLLSSGIANAGWVDLPTPVEVEFVPSNANSGTVTGDGGDDVYYGCKKYCVCDTDDCEVCEWVNKANHDYIHEGRLCRIKISTDKILGSIVGFEYQAKSWCKGRDYCNDGVFSDWGSNINTKKADPTVFRADPAPFAHNENNIYRLQYEPSQVNFDDWFSWKTFLWLTNDLGKYNFDSYFIILPYVSSPSDGTDFNFYFSWSYGHSQTPGGISLGLDSYGPPAFKIKITKYYVPELPTLIAPTNELEVTDDTGNLDVEFQWRASDSSYVDTYYFYLKNIKEVIVPGIFTPNPADPEAVFDEAKHKYDVNELGYGNYEWEVKSCNRIPEDTPGSYWHECSPKAEGQFTILEREKPNVKLQIDMDGDGTKENYKDGDTTPWFNLDRDFKVKCDDPDNGVGCRDVGFKEVSCPSKADFLSGTDVEKVTYSEPYPSPGYYESDGKVDDLSSKVIICSAAADGFDNFETATVIVQIDKIAPVITPPESVLPGVEFEIEAHDEAGGSGMRKIKWCQGDVLSDCTVSDAGNCAGTCDGVKGTINCPLINDEEAPDQGDPSCSDDTQTVPEGKKKVYRAIDVAGNPSDPVSTAGVVLEVDYGSDDVWINEDQDITVTVSSAYDIAATKMCIATSGDCEPLVDGVELTDPTLGYTKTMKGTYEYDYTNTLSEQEDLLNFGANDVSGSESNSVLTSVKIDITDPSIAAECCLGTGCDDDLCTRSDFVNVKITPSDGLSGIDKTRFCIYESDECTVDYNDNGCDLPESGVVEVKPPETVCGVTIVESSYIIKAITWDNADNSKEVTKSITIGTATGSIVYDGGFTQDTTLDITVTKSDQDSTGFKIFQRTATLANGVCGTYSERTQVGGLLTLFDEIIGVTGLESGKCYKFEADIIFTDFGVVTVSNTNEVKVDNQEPSFSLIVTPALYVEGLITWVADTFTMSWSGSDLGGSGFGITPISIESGSCSPATDPCTPTLGTPGLFGLGEIIVFDNLQNNYLYKFELIGTDRAGNTGEEEKSVGADLGPPTCVMGDDSPVTSSFTIPLTGTDDESGIKEFEIGLKEEGGTPLNIYSMCNYGSGDLTYILTADVDGNGDFSCNWAGDEGTYIFTCKPFDNVGNDGPLVSVEKRIVITPPTSFFTRLPDWINKITFPIQFGSGTPVDSFFVKYRYNPNPNRPGPETAWTRWFNLGEFTCTPDKCTEGSLTFDSDDEVGSDTDSYSFMFSLYSESDGLLEDVCDEDDVADPDCINRLMGTTIDVLPPEYTATFIDNIKAVVGWIIIPGNVGNVKMDIDASDSVSGVSVLKWTTGGDWNDCGSGDSWGGSVNCPIEILYETGLVKLNVELMDRAENYNNIEYSITTHPLAAFDSNYIVIRNGETYLLGVTIWELLGETQTIDLSLEDYDLAKFVESEGRVIEDIVLQPWERKRFFIEIPSRESGQDYKLKMIAVSDVFEFPPGEVFEDESEVRIDIGFPPGFSGLEEFSIILLLILSVGIYKKRL
ncbi:MAG: hypothetical protein ISS36_00165 [Candidatus Aenigmarchaeota archaeon]|nr:hypothetical protein [Candidatus Aenigmarchaeota archaeon]